MENIVVSIIDKLPQGYVMAALPVAVVVGVWVFTHIRRDKQGKWYFYSQKYEDRKRNKKQDVILQEIKSSKQTFEDVRKDVLQLQICAVNLPKTARRQAYIKYKQSEYNGWMDEYVVEAGLLAREEVAYISSNKEDA
jgi:predicted RNase H-related nuclease YkuK (DUF458 family)